MERINSPYEERILINILDDINNVDFQNEIDLRRKLEYAGTMMKAYPEWSPEIMVNLVPHMCEYTGFGYTYDDIICLIAEAPDFTEHDLI